MKSLLFGMTLLMSLFAFAENDLEKAFSFIKQDSLMIEQAERALSDMKIDIEAYLVREAIYRETNLFLQGELNKKVGYVTFTVVDSLTVTSRHSTPYSEKQDTYICTASKVISQYLNPGVIGAIDPNYDSLECYNTDSKKKLNVSEWQKMSEIYTDVAK